MKGVSQEVKAGARPSASKTLVELPLSTHATEAGGRDGRNGSGCETGLWVGVTRAYGGKP